MLQSLSVFFTSSLQSLSYLMLITPRERLLLSVFELEMALNLHFPPALKLSLKTTWSDAFGEGENIRYGVQQETLRHDLWRRGNVQAANYRA